MAFIRNSFSVLALIFTVAVPYHARDSHYTIVQLANSQLAVYLPPSIYLFIHPQMSVMHKSFVTTASPPPAPPPPTALSVLSYRRATSRAITLLFQNEISPLAVPYVSLLPDTNVYAKFEKKNRSKGTKVRARKRSADGQTDRRAQDGRTLKVRRV